jgi:1,4-dihydroxy-2-naphthoate octaprenyltransferase
MLAANKIRPQQMKQVLVGLSGSILGLGIFTLMYAYRTYAISSYAIGVLLIFGLLAIAAAVMYTVGKKAYGYAGFGDVSVILFFGIVPVVGIGVLMGVGPQTSLWLGGIGIGLLSAAVLNINNYRDLNSDKKSGKRTLAVSIGPKATLQYQRFLLILGFTGLFGSLAYDLYQLLKLGSSTYSIEMLLLFGVFSPSAVFLSRYYSEMRALKPGERDALNLQLKRVSLTILILCVIHFGLSFYVTSLFR